MISINGYWQLTVIGNILGVNRVDVDKTGRHRKFFYEYNLEPVSYQHIPSSAQLPDTLLIRISDKDFQNLGLEILAVGDFVELIVTAHGPKPTSFYANEITKITPLE